jgi:2-polyprenyl-3-methyl-5-hydroxy-6-metoxy-1,4-benzoquinol methylase
VLDLGAGAGAHAALFAELGAHVAAVDCNPPCIRAAGVVRINLPIERWLRASPVDVFDVIFARHVLQQLDRRWVFEALLPTLSERTAPSGIVAIETFFGRPEPPWSAVGCSLFRAKELADAFAGWSVLWASEDRERGDDLSRQRRVFQSVRVIVQQKSA